MANSNPPRYYVLNEKVPFEEDATHEFKGHTSISEQDIPAIANLIGPRIGRRSRQPVSRTICAFLNSYRGGCIYCGILDSGTIHGVTKTQYQKDHLRVTIDDLLSRYEPAVDKHRINISFIPVVYGKSSMEKIIDVVHHNSRASADPEQRKQPHKIGKHADTCWCVLDAKARFANVTEPPLYIIEITVSEWDPNDPRHTHFVGEMKMFPIHEDETKTVYVRRQGTVVSYNCDRIQMLAKQAVRNEYHNQVKDLRDELSELQKLADNNCAPVKE